MQPHQTSLRSRQRAPRRRPSPMPTLLALLLAGVGAAQAQTWSGAGVTSNWSDAANWQGFARPTPSASTVVTFAGSSRLAPNQDMAQLFTLNTLRFASGAGAFDLSGNALRFAGADARVEQNSTTAVVVRNDLQLASSLVYTGVGSASFTGLLSVAAGTDRAAVTLSKRGSGDLSLTSANPFDGRVAVEAGRVVLRNALALQNASVVLAVDKGLSFGNLAQATLGNLSGSGELALGTIALTLGGNDLSTEVFSGNITGSTATLIKAGTATTRLSGTSQFNRLQVDSGRVQLEGGSVQLTNASNGLTVGTGGAAAARGGVLSLRNGATLTALGDTARVDGVEGTVVSIGGTGSRVTTGFQTLVGLDARGTLQVRDGGTMAAGTFLAMGFNNDSSGTLLIEAGGTVTATVGLLGVLPGSQGRADVSGAQARWLSNGLGIGGYTATQRGGSGTLNIANGGHVQASDAVSFWTATSSASIDGGSLLAGRLVSDGAVGSIALLADPAGGAALVLNGTVDGSFAGTLSGSGSLHKTGSGAQTLAGSSTGFTGTTTIAGGRIVVGHQDALRGSSVLIETANGLDLNGQPGVVLGSLGGSGALALGSTQLTLGEDNRNTRYTGRLSGNTGSWLVKKGTGTLTLAGTGSTLASLVTEGGGAVVLDGGSLQLTANASGVAANERPALEVGAGGRLEVRNGGRLSTNGPGASTALVGGNAATEMLVDGLGSRFDGGFQTIVGVHQAGRLTLRNGAAYLGWGYLLAGFNAGSDGTITLESGATAGAGLVGLGVLAGSTGTLVASGAGTRLDSSFELGLGGLFNNQQGGTGHLQVQAGATVRTPLTQFWTAASSLSIDGGSMFTGGLAGAPGIGSITLTPAAGSFAAVLIVDGSIAAASSSSYGGSIDGDGGLMKTGPGTQVLAGRNTFAGPVQVLGGTLQMSSSAAFEHSVAFGARLQLNERNLGGAVVDVAGGGTVVYGGPTLNGGLLLGTGTHDISALQRLVGTSIGNGVVVAPASGATLLGVSNAGRVDIGAGTSINWRGGGNTAGTLNVGGHLSTSGFHSGGEIQIADTGLLLNTSTDLLLTGGSRTFVGSAAAPGGAIGLQDGTRLQLNGALLVNNGVISGPVEVNHGSLLKGGGQFGSVAVNDGGRFAPGNSPGLARTGNAIWGAGGLLELELAAASGAAGLHWDLWFIQGGLDITAGTTANSRFTVRLSTLDGNDQPAPLAGFDPLQSWQWLVVATTGGITGFDPTRLALDTRSFASSTAGGSFSLAMQGGDLYLNFAPVPEPGSWALLLGGLAGLGWVARRRRGQTSG